MSNEELVEKLEILKHLIEWEHSLDYVVALDEAIRRLKADGQSEEVDGRTS